MKHRKANMSVELTNKDDGSISAFEMKDGQLGVIVSGTVGRHYQGKVVQKYDTKLICVGYHIGGTWGVVTENSPIRVRLLKAGETITVVDN
jgi:hypothetical protein